MAMPLPEVHENTSGRGLFQTSDRLILSLRCTRTAPLTSRQGSGPGGTIPITSLQWQELMRKTHTRQTRQLLSATEDAAAAV